MPQEWLIGNAVVPMPNDSAYRDVLVVNPSWCRRVFVSSCLCGKNPSPSPKCQAKSFEDLIVWQKAHAFTLQVYAATQKFPKDEIYGLTSQFRRAAVSVPANIAEGFRKRSEQDKARYANIAEGSLEECRYYLILAHDLGLLDRKLLWEASEEVRRLLNAYHTAIATRPLPARDAR